MRFGVGDLVDRYRLIERLGSGGQGEVWKASDGLDGQVRAIKLVDVADASPAQVERARREARALAGLRHPSLVRCHGLFEDLNRNALGIVLDFVDGVALAGALGDARLGSEHRGWIARHIAHALAYLHSQGVVHRDLKPANVLLAQSFWAAPAEPSGVKLVDFGIAVPDTNPRPLTAAGHVVGTPAYMAPELLDPMRFGMALSTPAADVFAYGVLLWQLMGGEHPTGLGARRPHEDYLAEYRRFADSAPPWSTRVPEGAWRDLVLRCLSLHVSARLTDGMQVSARLDAIAQVLPSMQAAMTSVEGATSVGAGVQPAPVGVPTATTVAHGPRAGGPAVIPPAPAAVRRAERSSVALWGGLFAVGAVITLMIVGGWWLASARETGPLAPSATMSATVADKTEFTCPEVGGKRCPSGRGCGGPCGDALEPSDEFHLRASGAVLDTGDVPERFPGAVLCFGVGGSGPNTCTPLAETTDAGVPRKSLAVTVRTLHSRGLDILIRDGEEVLAHGSATPRNLKRRVLCDGLILQPSMTGPEKVVDVRFFLDDPAGPPPHRCLPKP